MADDSMVAGIWLTLFPRNFRVLRAISRGAWYFERV